MKVATEPKEDNVVRGFTPSDQSSLATVGSSGESSVGMSESINESLDNDVRSDELELDLAEVDVLIEGVAKSREAEIMAAPSFEEQGQLRLEPNEEEAARLETENQEQEGGTLRISGWNGVGVGESKKVRWRN